MVWQTTLSGLDWRNGLRLIKRGAESEIREGTFMGLRAIYKVRVPKEYMNQALDRALRTQRTLKEAKILDMAAKAGVRVPRLYALFPSAGLIVMEYVEGPTLKDLISSGDNWRPLAVEAGRQLGLLHRAGIVHGDSTTSNMVVSPRGLTLIDFGLAEFSTSVEDRAVDMHLLRRAVLSTHPSLASEFIDLFVKGYASVMGDAHRDVVARANEIELRGRYVSARRSVWAGEERS